MLINSGKDKGPEIGLGVSKDSRSSPVGPAVRFPLTLPLARTVRGFLWGHRLITPSYRLQPMWPNTTSVPAAASETLSRFAFFLPCRALHGAVRTLRGFDLSLRALPVLVVL